MSKNGPERTIENNTIKRLKALGLQVEWLKNRRRRGWSDLTVLFGERVAFAEMKQPGGKIQPHQLLEQEYQRSCGRVYEFFDSEDEAVEFFTRWRDGQISSSTGATGLSLKGGIVSDWTARTTPEPVASASTPGRGRKTGARRSSTR